MTRRCCTAVGLGCLATCFPTRAPAQLSVSTRPDASAGATRVEVGLYLIDMEAIDSVQQSFTADVLVRLRWRDDRVGPEGARIPLGDVWHPRVGILNQRDPSLQLEDSVAVRSGGIIEYAQRYYGEFSSRMDLRDFPYDQQELRLTLVS